MTKLTEAQLHLAQQIRTGVTQSNNKDEQRRVEIYQELFFNNLEDFCATTFPVLKAQWAQKSGLHLFGRFY
ncbi:HvfC/BufC family peptide modification chaperone [Psychrosphaera algicola]|uniref:DNA-binding domain-containing protein n=1 Tax=Psychrosphaera algicola TaxID=3023714 RepID=A0ABT5FIJ6_9GAMM|nr:putative DNA-binding domain-containing protein [Psychrosphaera sp. G1-22]MDC2891018.1 putative DNA-binding domain-containing protein [Psychrosphaera sp. G1-22]